MDVEEKKRFYRSLIFPAILVVIIWLIKLIEGGLHISFADLGLLPQTLSGLRGIVFSPLLHGDWAHLSANTVPLFVLTAGLFYYYGKKASTIFILCWLVTGIWVWIFAKDTGIHIGASGVVYALATFHFTSGILRREPRMMAFSLLVVFLYGGLVWGIIPDFFPEKNISWESHLLGGVAGILIAFGYREAGPQRKEYQWDDEDEEGMEYIEEEPPQSEQNPLKPSDRPREPANPTNINYIYKESKDELRN